MNKSELIDRVADRTSHSKTKTQTVIDSFLDEIAGAIARGEDVTLTGFGTFSRKIRKAKDGTNPITHEPLHTPEKKVAKFKAGKGLADRVAGAAR